MSQSHEPIEVIRIQGEPEIHGGGEIALKIWQQGVTIIKRYAISEPVQEGSAFLTWGEWKKLTEAIKVHHTS
jgi:hypothetical protein